MDWPRILFVLASLVVPILWGVVVHRSFEFAERRLKGNHRPNDNNFPDYQI